MLDENVFEITDLHETWSVSRRDELMRIAQIRYDGQNSIWINKRGWEVPNLNVGFNGGYAVANYCNDGAEQRDMFVSKSDGSAMPLDASTTFFLSEFGIEQPMENSVVVEAGKGIEVLLDFLENPNVKSKSIDWIEL